MPPPARPPAAGVTPWLGAAALGSGQGGSGALKRAEKISAIKTEAGEIQTGTCRW